MTEYDHDELAHNLAQHLKAEDRMVWENVPAGPSGSVRPDVLVMRKSFTQPNPITYEVKVSLSDFRSDVTKAKWKAYLDFSYGVVFAVPKGLVTKNDLPDGCGLITYNGEGMWHTVKKPTLSPCTIDSNVLLKLLMGGEKRMSQAKPIQPREFDRWKHNDTLRRKFGDDIGEKLALIDKYPSMKMQLHNLKTEISEALGMSDTSSFNFISNAQYKIKQLRALADEKARKKLIAEDLIRAKHQMDLRFIRLVNDLAPELGEDLKK